MLNIDDSTIYLTRGDSALIQLSLTDSDGNTYSATDGDVIRFSLKKRMSDSYDPLLTIDIPTDTLILTIEPEDTQSLKYSRSRPYKYDIEITYASGRVDTFIADADIYILPEVDVYE